MDLKINDKVDVLVNDDIYSAIVDSISTRETEVELSTYYHLKINDGDEKISVSISKIKYKKNC